MKSEAVSSTLLLFTGTRKTRGEIREQIRVQRVQPGVLTSQGHQPREHQVLPEQGRSADRGGAPACPGCSGEDDPHRPELNTPTFNLHGKTPGGPGTFENCHQETTKKHPKCLQ